ncbi:MAG: class II fructose-bisphosphate aldolase [Alphaproteobacteria bacterium]
MPLVNLNTVMQKAQREKYAVCGLVVLGWEDARAYVAAAEAVGSPVILQAGPGCRAHTPLSVLGEMFRCLARDATVPVVAHLDHSYNIEECREAIECGFTSVMYDGSRSELDKNVEDTAAVVEMARGHGVSVEGEIGFVGYDSGEASSYTKPEEAARFAKETRVDAMAVSVGNVHLQQTKAAEISFDAIRSIEDLTVTPLVLHGGSGIPSNTRRKLALETNVCKFNIGTELRMEFGKALRQVLAQDEVVFDRLNILKATELPLEIATRKILKTTMSNN